MRPLYCAGPDRAGPQADLPAISVDEPVSREEQVFRNALLFGLRGGGEGDPPRYDLIYRLTIREQEILVERVTGTPNAYQLTGGVSFLVKEIATGALDLRHQRDGDRFLHALLAELCQHPRPPRRRGPPGRGACRADAGAPRRLFRHALSGARGRRRRPQRRRTR